MLTASEQSHPSSCRWRNAPSSSASPAPARRLLYGCFKAVNHWGTVEVPTPGIRPWKRWCWKVAVSLGPSV